MKRLLAPKGFALNLNAGGHFAMQLSMERDPLYLKVTRSSSMQSEDLFETEELEG